MSAGLILLIVIAIILYILFKKVNYIVDTVEEKVSEVKELTDNPKETAYTLGASVAEAALNRIKTKKTPGKKRKK